MKKVLYSLIAAAACILSVACQKNDGDIDYGNTLIYIPQATVNGGLGNDYVVPSGAAENTQNFAVKNDRVEVFLGVMRSGKEAGQAFTVGIAVDQMGSTMPQSLFTLPSRVSVEAGHNQATFTLSLDKAALSGYKGQVLNLIIKLENPSAYALAQKNTSVNVVVNVDDLLARL